MSNKPFVTVIICGDHGSGKTEVLRTMLAALTAKEIAGPVTVKEVKPSISAEEYLVEGPYNTVRILANSFLNPEMLKK